MSYSFVDLFAGCGGLSLGLFRAGWRGLFGVEKDRFAFDTLTTNLLSENGRYCYSWPLWLPQKPFDLSDLLTEFQTELAEVGQSLDLLVGGPPCQGFSSAGRRDPADPRNQLLELYLEAVELLNPKFILIENVRGITMDFVEKGNNGPTVNYSKILIEVLSQNYDVETSMLNTAFFGVPQARTRFFVVAKRKDLLFKWDPFGNIEDARASFLRRKGLLETTPSCAALSDLEITRNGTEPNLECRGFQQISYVQPLTSYQKLMRDGMVGAPSDTRLARHRTDIVARFEQIIELCHREGHLNTSLKREYREMFGLRKQAIRVLDPDNPSPTITSMPDDLLHYSEPRTLTVRENARLQSFPDWFVFKGKYTTGGHLRRLEVPRFTQVANAVPPLVAEAIGAVLFDYAKSNHDGSTQSLVPRRDSSNPVNISL